MGVRSQRCMASCTAAAGSEAILALEEPMAVADFGELEAGAPELALVVVLELEVEPHSNYYEAVEAEAVAVAKIAGSRFVASSIEVEVEFEMGVMEL